MGQRKHSLPNVCSAASERACEQGEEEGTTPGRVPELDKGYEWGKGRPNFSVQWSNWDCVGAADLHHQ